jgi:transketolase
LETSLELLTEKETTDLETLALRVRESVVKMSTDGGCFLGASLSAVDILVYLYQKQLNIPNLKDPARDYFLLSKGHDVPALYGLFAEMGILEKDRLKNHLKTNDHIYWHPNTKIPGVEFHSGSLGHCLSVGMGIAVDCKWKGLKNKVYVMTGDGELNEGSIWEGLLVASALKLDNLVVVVDRNEFQANLRTEELIPLEPLEAKFESFGVQAVRVDGHSYPSMHEAFSKVPFGNVGPSAVICQTRRGKGLPSIEARADRWFCNFSSQEIEQLLKELHGDKQASLTSETLIVR